MPIAIFLFILVMFLVIGAVESGVMLWTATKVVRLKNLSLKRALVWNMLMTVVSLMAMALAARVGPEAGETITGAAVLGVMIAVVVALKRIGSCGKGRAIAVVPVWMVLTMVAIVPVSLAMKLTLIDAFVQTGEAMEPTLRDADQFLVDRTASAKRFDLIVFTPPHDPSTLFISRLIGLPGETVEIVGGRIRIDGKETPLPAGMIDIAYKTKFLASMRDESSMRTITGGPGNPVTLGPDECFVLGDNTVNANDSRFWPATNGKQAGALPEANIMGVARMIYSPLSRFRIFR